MLAAAAWEVIRRTSSDRKLRMVDWETGTEGNSRGEAVAGVLSGQRLAPLKDAYVAFWFAWSVYYPTIEVFTC